MAISSALECTLIFRIVSYRIVNWTRSICFDFVERRKFHEKKLVRHCCQKCHKVERCFNTVAGVDGVLYSHSRTRLWWPCMTSSLDTIRPLSVPLFSVAYRVVQNRTVLCSCSFLNYSNKKYHKEACRRYHQKTTRWLYCVECPQYSIRLDEHAKLHHLLFVAV